MKKLILLTALSVSAFAFKTPETNPHSVHVGPTYLKKGASSYNGVAVNYERFMPEGFYLGVDALCVQNNDLKHRRSETRFGYTTANTNGTYYTPYMAFGHLHSEDTLSEWDYGYQAIGTHLNLASTSFLAFGASAQIMAFQSFKNVQDENFYGWEVSTSVKLFPETFDIEIKPYFTKLNSLEKETHKGVKCSIGYVF